MGHPESLDETPLSDVNSASCPVNYYTVRGKALQLKQGLLSCGSDNFLAKWKFIYCDTTIHQGWDSKVGDRR